MKIIALDVGDRWTGIAISDSLKMLARPLQTEATADLVEALKNLFKAESIDTVVVGLPKTLRGTESEQTLKIKEMAAELEKQFPQMTWQFWDERLTSKQAAQIKPTRTKDDKLKSHAVAAALILGSYLDYLRFKAAE